MSFTFQVTAGGATVPTNPSGPGAVITIVGGPNATANIPGSQQDPADLYGIVLVLIGIALAILVVRWVFGRGSQKAGQGGS